MSLRSVISRKVLYTSSRRVIVARKFSTEENIVRSPVPDVEIPNSLLQDYLFRKLDKWSHKIAAECLDTNKKYTYGEVHQFSKNLAGFIQKCGLQKGDTAAIMLPNVPEYFIAILGLLQAGITITPINPLYTAGEIVRQLQGSNAKLAITTSTLHTIVRQASDAIQNVNFQILTIGHTQNDSLPAGSINFHEICGKSYEFKDPNIGLDDVAFLPYSSGTTGLPKGVQLTHRSTLSNLVQGSAKEFTMNIETNESQQDVVPLMLPMFHIYGLASIGLTMFNRGVKMITVPKFSTTAFIKLLKDHDPNLLYCVPPMILMLLNNSELELVKLDSLRTILCGAAPLGSSDIYRFYEKFKDKSLLQIYGMTECSPMSHHQTSLLDHGIKIGGSGFALPNTLCKIVDVSDPEYKGLGPNLQGELLIKGPQIMKGYLNNPEANKNIFIDGWLRTGDIGYYDNVNHFYITDRLKELIKVSGFQVAPAELESLLRDHPLIEDAAVAGIPDERSGEAPKAFVVLRKQHKLSAEDIKSFIMGKVVKYKQLTGGVKIVDVIPRTASGKILRKELKNL